MANETEGGWKMTRETKVGLVVAGSFLLLVGVVVVCKFRDIGPHMGEPRAEVKDEIVPEETPSSEKPVPSPPASPAVTEVAVAPTPIANPSPPVIEATPAPPPGSIVPDNDPRLSPPPASGQPATVMQAGGTDTRAPLEPLPPPVTPPTTEPETPPPGGGSTPPAPVLESSGPPPVAPPEPPPPSGPPTVAPPTGGSLVTPPPPALDPLPPPAGSLPPAPTDTHSPTAPVAPVPPPESRPATDIRSVTPVPSGSPPPAAISPPVPADNRGPTTGNPGGASLAPPGGAAPIPPASGGTTIPPPTVRPVTADQGIRQPIPAAPAAPVAPPESFVQGGRPIGTASGISAPPITVPAASSGARPPLALAPQVESFDEEEYRVKQGDTFQAICTRFYQTDKYAPALLLFNRNHPLASPGVRQEPPALQPGQAIFLPPTRILEKRYGSAVPELPSPAAHTRGAAGERSSHASPGAAPAPSHPQYRVQGPDEMLWSIAQRYLGNGERWRDIHKLNPTIRPELAVPVGTVLNLPAETQAQPAARP